MTKNENKPLSSLVNDPETVREILEGETEPGKSDSLNPLKVVNEAKELDYPESRVLVEVMKGQTTPAAIADNVDISESKAETVLSKLRLSGYLKETEAKNKDGGYAISTVWSKEEFPSGPIIPLVYQFNLLSDRNRIESLNEAIEDVVEGGDVVADLGAGAGILSYLASQRAEQVYAVEVDQDVYEHGKKFFEEQGIKNVEYIQGDARTEELSEQADVVICEMLDTALAAELQVPVMNRAVDNLLKQEGETIPHRARTTVSLVQTDYTFFDVEFRLPHFEAYGSRESTQLSKEVDYHDICFQERNELFVMETVTVSANKSGTVNGIQLNTYVQFSEGIDETDDSGWLNPPLNLPTETDIHVDAGDELEVHLSYELGGGLNKIEYSVSNVDD